MPPYLQALRGGAQHLQARGPQPGGIVDRAQSLQQGPEAVAGQLLEPVPELVLHHLGGPALAPRFLG